MAKFFINLTLNGVLHKKIEGGFHPLNTFNDGFEFQVECEEGEVKEAVDRVLSDIRFMLRGETNEKTEKTTTKTEGGKLLPHDKEGES